MQTMQSAVQPVSTLTHHFKFYEKEDVLSLTRIRRFETKLGERIQVINDRHHLEQSLQRTTARYVLFGVPEDIGVYKAMILSVVKKFYCWVILILGILNT